MRGLEWLIFAAASAFGACATFNEPASAADGGAGAGADAGGGADCPGTHGPKGVRVGTFCIDETEVTRGQYQEFVAAKAGDMSGQGPGCAANATYIPAGGWSPEGAFTSYPVGNVDWCDAKAFCAWAGKRLCGKITGGSLLPNEAGRAEASQWTQACASAPPSSASAVCNFGAAGSGAIAPVASHPECKGSTGIYDLLGNVWEWIDACQSTDSNAGCILKGEDFSTQGPVDCGNFVTQPRMTTDFDRFGFRCCSD